MLHTMQRYVANPISRGTVYLDSFESDFDGGAPQPSDQLKGKQISITIQVVFDLRNSRTNICCWLVFYTTPPRMNPHRPRVAVRFGNVLRIVCNLYHSSVKWVFGIAVSLANRFFTVRLYPSVAVRETEVQLYKATQH
jgi:hypothetical protein